MASEWGRPPPGSDSSGSVAKSLHYHYQGTEDTETEAPHRRNSSSEAHLGSAPPPRSSAVEEIAYDSIDVPEVQATDHWTKKVRHAFAFLGPGCLVAMGYLDPGNMEGDLAIGGIRSPDFDPQSGKQDYAGYYLLWVVLAAHMGGLLFQILASRLGNVTGNDLATLCRLGYSKRISRSLWLLVEVAIIGADFQAVIGTAIALRLMTGIPTWVGVLLTLLEAFFFLAIQFYGVRKLELLFAALIAVMSTCFFINGIASKPKAAYILSGMLIPRLPKGEWFKALGVVGCIIMPHNLFLHSALVQSRNVKRTSTAAVRDANFFFSLEAALTLLVAFCVNAAVVCTFAHPGLVVPKGHDAFTLETGYLALKQVFSENSAFIWALGLFAAGQNSTMAGTYSGQFVMQGFLNLEISPVTRITIARLITLVPLTCIILLSEASLDAIAEWINVLQATVLPFTLIPLLKLSRSKVTLDKFAMTKTWVWVSWVIAAVVFSANLVVAGSLLATSNFGLFGKVLASVGCVCYAVCIVVLARKKIDCTPLSQLPSRAESAATIVGQQRRSVAGVGELYPLAVVGDDRLSAEATSPSRKESTSSSFSDVFEERHTQS